MPARAAGFDPWSAGKALVFVACLMPLARLLWLGRGDGLGTNPVEFVTRSTGTWTLVMLCATLTVTPLRRLTGWNALARWRRMLGLFAFFYGVLHASTWVWFDQWFDVGAMLADLWRRPFIAAGFAAFVLLVPLALTSTQAAMRRLGRRWQQLHRLAYASAILGVLHYWWHKAGKNDLTEPALYATVLAVLLGWRVVARWRAARATPARRDRG